MVSTVVEEDTIVIESVHEDRDSFTRSDSYSKVLLIADESATELCTKLSYMGSDCVRLTYSEALFEALREYEIEILIIDMESIAENITDGLAIARKLKTSLETRVIALVPDDYLVNFDVAIGVDDFAVKPCTSAELNVRIKQILWKARDIDDGNLIKHGDMVIDMDKYEVSVAGKLISLSFKEYELLKVLITNKDRVMTRETLLDKVWGHDYFGGDRTVDVHIRRLRAKIEDAEHTFIETVRNVGYKFNNV